MANVRRAKGEDVQAEARPTVAVPSANVAPTAPKAPNASGGAPKLQGMIDINRPDLIGQDQFDVKVPKVTGKVTFDEIAQAYEGGARQAMGAFRPRRAAAQPWRADQAQTNLGKTYRENLDSESLIQAPAPPWTIKQVREAEPEFVAAVREKLWDMYTKATPEEQNSDFFQGIRQNPDYAAATMVRRMIMNSQQRDAWMTGDAVPKLGEAVRNSLQMSNTWRWLNYIQGNQAKPSSALSVTPPRAAEGGLAAIKALRKG